jgi:DNA-binding CsgD family transcriptional regulator
MPGAERTIVEERTAGVVAGTIGRARELGTIERFLDTASGGPGVLVLEGEAGIGKTTLWEAGIDFARGRGLRVLSTRPSGAEAELSFATLIDLLDGVEPDELAALPVPQRRALEVALLRAEPAGAPPEAHAIRVGFLNALRALAVSEPLLIAADDVQWIDAPSAEALAFAGLRIQDDRVRFLLATRPGGSFALERALDRRGVARLDIGPLGVGETRRLLFERLGLSVRPQPLRRIVAATRGNPLFALEFGRALVERGLPAVGEEILVPDVVEDLLGTRVDGLPRPVRRLLLAVALSGDLRTSELGAIEDQDALDDATDAGLLLVERGHVRASHPLLAEAAKQRASAGERRELHLELSHAVADEELRALHLALATILPNEQLAGRVAGAAAGAAARGAAQEAVVLAEHALRLTAAGSDQRSERLLGLASYLGVAGERERVTALLSPELESLPPGGPRGRAFMMLVGGVVQSNDEARSYFERALGESTDEPALRARALAELASNDAVVRVVRLPEAEALALEALRLAPAAGPEEQRAALHALAWARSLRGRAIDDLCERFRAASDAAHPLIESTDRVAGQRLAWRGEAARARAVLSGLVALAGERAEAVSHAWLQLNLCELELRVGGWEAASELLAEWAESPEAELPVWPQYERCHALLAAGVGLAAEAERWGGQAIARAQLTGIHWDLLEATRACGIAALLGRDPGRAAESLRGVWEHTQREGVDEPGAFPVAPDLVEALTELGELDEARKVTERLRALADELKHPWGHATATRCDALVRLAADWDERAAGELAEAAAAYGGLGLPFDRARALLALGRAQRRSRRWGLARRSLEQAARAFDALGSGGWAEQARVERARVGGRKRRPDGALTPSEQRVVELACEGLSNKEIASALVVSVRTVEAHLSNAYTKLGVTSRTQLARSFSRRA